MNGMEMLISAMGIDPKQIASDFGTLKDQVILTLKSIDGKLAQMQESQTRQEKMLEELTNAGRSTEIKAELKEKSRKSRKLRKKFLEAETELQKAIKAEDEAEELWLKTQVGEPDEQTSSLGNIDLGKDNDPDGENFPVINPGDIIASGETDTGDYEPKRRGRPKGSKNAYRSATAKKEASLDLTQVLYSTHLMLSALTKIEELKIEKEEAKELSDAVVRVNDLYGGLVIPEKALAWINLGIVGVKVYGPRVAAHTIKTGKKKQNQTQQTVNTVAPIMFDPHKANIQN